MFGLQKYDLRFRNLPWLFRDSYVGAANTDTKGTATMKRKLGKQVLWFVAALSITCVMLSLVL